MRMEKEGISAITFSDRRLGFYESFEKVLFEVAFGEKLCDASYILDVMNGWGEKVRTVSLPVKAGTDKISINLGAFPLGWYRLYLHRQDSTEIINDYMAFIVTVPLSERKYKDTCIAADVAAEYEPKTMAYGEEFVRTLLLQGFDWIRGRTNICKWGEETLDFRKKVSAAGIKVTSLSTNDMYNMPKIKSMDLRDTYRTYKEGPSLNEISSEMYELQNESDLFFNTPALPDALTAYSKAAVIGLTDSGKDPFVSMTGMAFCTDAIYYDLQLQNGILDYSNIYNYHGYEGIESKASYARKAVLAYSPEGATRAIYMTENGKKVWADQNEIVYENQQFEMCRYAMTASAKILAEGTDKWFWFIARAFLETGGGFGNMHAWTHQPYPVASTLSNLTHQLGMAKYIGKLADLPEKTWGYLFDHGEHDVAILYSRGESTVKLLAERLTVVDMFGGERTLTADESGYITLVATKDPVFVVFHDRVAESICYKSAYEVTRCEKLTFTDTQRVVLNAIWEDQDLMNSLIMQKGYLFDETDEQRVTLRIYNLNDKPVSGRAYVEKEYSDHFDVTVKNAEFTAEAWGRADVEIVLKTTGKAMMNSAGDLKFGVVLDNGEEPSAAVCRYWFKADDMNVADEDIVRFEGFMDESNWNLKNIMTPGSMSMDANEAEQSITIKADHGGSYAQWFFPEYFVKNPEILDGADGIVFRRKHSADVKTKLTAFVCLKDGRSYWSGDASGVKMTEDWKTVTFPWETFMIFASPEGFNDPRPFDPKQIYMVRIGASGTPKDFIPDTTVKDFGIYYDRFNATVAHPGRITVDGVEEAYHYSDSKNLHVVATLPEDVIGDVRVHLGKTPYGKWTLCGNRVEIDLTSLGRGEYVLQVSGKTRMNYRYAKYTTFYIEG
ncbi:MAG: hypothetical protein IJY39_13180 [Clostridia bacterium]|nr:hypothetical protein [Clostridia bacterium]